MSSTGYSFSVVQDLIFASHQCCLNL